jgi:hypothetical protein
MSILFPPSRKENGDMRTLQTHECGPSPQKFAYPCSARELSPLIVTWLFFQETWIDQFSVNPPARGRPPSCPDAMLPSTSSVTLITGKGCDPSSCNNQHVLLPFSVRIPNNPNRDYWEGEKSITMTLYYIPVRENIKPK